MSRDEYQCSTCGFATSNVGLLACGNWSWCGHYAEAEREGTLPRDSGDYTNPRGR